MRLLTLAALVAAFSLPASAQHQCNTRESVMALLANRYRESPVAVGVTNTGGLVEVLASKDGSTWTIIVTTPQGMSCLVAAGEGWRSIAPGPADPKA